jgi:hypothetical protein
MGTKIQKELPNDASTPQNQSPMNLQLKLAWHLTCVPQGKKQRRDNPDPDAEVKKQKNTLTKPEPQKNT